MAVDEEYPLVCIYKGFKILEIQHYDGTFSHYVGSGDGERTKHYTPCNESLDVIKQQIDRFWDITYKTRHLAYKNHKTK